MRNMSWKTKALAMAGAAALFAGSVNSAKALSLGGYSGPITIQIKAYDEGVLYQRGASTDAGVTGAGSVDLLTQSSPVGANPGEDTWGIFVINNIQDNVGNFLYNRATASTILTGIIWNGSDVFVKTQTVGTSEQETIHTNGSEIAVFEQTAVGFNIANFGALGPSARNNTNPLKPVYGGVTTGNLIWTFNTVPGALLPNTDQQYSVSNGTFDSLPTAVVTSGNGGFEAATGLTGWGTGTQNDMFQAAPDGSDITATFGFPKNTLDQGQSLGWTVGAADPIDAVVVPTPSAIGMGAVAMVGLMLNRVRRTRRTR